MGIENLKKENKIFEIVIYEQLIFVQAKVF